MNMELTLESRNPLLKPAPQTRSRGEWSTGVDLYPKGVRGGVRVREGDLAVSMDSA
jgi:hypothetical protein